MEKGYAQIYGMDYSKNFSLGAKITFLHLFISLATSYGWSFHQSNVKHAFLHHDLHGGVWKNMLVEKVFVWAKIVPISLV